MPIPDMGPDQHLPLHCRPIPEIEVTLGAVLGRTTLQYILKVDWAKDAVDGQEPMDTAQSEATLRQAAEVVEIWTRNRLSPVDMEGLLFGMNPRLDNEAPVSLFREGRGAEVVRVASASLQQGG